MKNVDFVTGADWTAKKDRNEQTRNKTPKLLICGLFGQHHHTTHTHTQRNKETNKEPNKHTHTQTNTQRHKQTHTKTHTHNSHTQTRTSTQRHESKTKPRQASAQSLHTSHTDPN